MSKMIQLRHVPDHVHRRLKARAALSGLSLSDYLLEEVRLLVERPTLAEMRQRLAERPAVAPRPSALLRKPFAVASRPLALLFKPIATDDAPPDWALLPRATDELP